MGSDQSTRRENQESRDARQFDRAIEERLRQAEQRMETRLHSRITITNVRTDQDAASKKDLERALDDQRKVYEQKIKNILQKKDSASTSTPEREAASRKDLEKALEEQRELYENKMKSLLDNQPQTPPPVQLRTPFQHVGIQQAPNASIYQPLQHVGMPQSSAQTVYHHQQEAARQAAARQGAQQAAQQAAQQEVAKQAAARQAAQQAAQQEAAKQTAARQAAQQEAAKQTAAQKAAQQEAAKQAAAQQAAAQIAQRAAAAQRTADQQRAFVQQAVQQQMAGQQVTPKKAGQQAASQTAEQLADAQRRAAIESIAIDSIKKMQSQGLTLREQLNYSINTLYPQLDAINKQGTPSPKPPASTSGGKNFKNTQNAQKSQTNNEDDDPTITCPTCRKRYGNTIRIYNCGEGHSICQKCKMSNILCSICQQTLTEKRVKCLNADAGCRLFIKIACLSAHEKECPFKEMPCPSPWNCPWTGKLPDLIGHFKENHPNACQGNVDTELFLPDFKTTSRYTHFIKIGNFNFLFQIKVDAQKNNIYMLAQLIGTKHSASKWIYEIHVYNKREPRRKFQFTDRCTSNREAFNDIFGKANCAVIPFVYAETFFNEGTLAYKFYIKREEENYNNEEVKENKVNRRARSKVRNRNA